MRLVRHDGGRTGVLIEREGNTVVLDAEAVLGAERSWLGAIEQWHEVGPALAGLDGSGTPLDDVTLEAPLPDPAVRIFALGGNYPLHVARASDAFEVSDSVRNATRETTPPWGFAVLPGTVVGSGVTVTPPAFVQKLDYEAEVAAVLGGPIDPEAPLAVWGYTAWNDFSIRDAALGLSKEDHGPLSWAVTKNFHTGNGCGPWMVVDPDVDLNDLRITCRVNGEVRQDDSTAGMTYSFEDVFRHLTTYLPLGAGDMVLSGSPSGTAMEGGLDGPFLQDGDEVEVEVTGAGVLRNTIRR